MQRAEARGSPRYLGVVLCPVRVITVNPIEVLIYLLAMVRFFSLSVAALCKQSILTKALSFTICPASFFILCCTLTEVLTAFHRNILRENTSLTRVEKGRREFELVLKGRELSF